MLLSKQKGGMMNKTLILAVLSILLIAIAGPKIGEIVTEKRMARAIKILQVAQEIEVDRLKKINDAHMEVIREYQKGE